MSDKTATKPNSPSEHVASGHHSANTHLSVAAFEKAYHQMLVTRPGILASESGGELAWMKKARERDLARWSSEGLPTRRDEAWKYASFTMLETAKIGSARVLSSQKLPQREIFPRLSGDNLVEIVFLNGQFVRSWSKGTPTQSDVTVHVLSELLSECVERGWTHERRQKFAAFREQVEISDSNRENVFAAMNTSFMQDAILIEVKSGASAELPIVIYHYTHVDEANLSAGVLQLSAPRVFARVGDQSRASVIEVQAGLADQPYLNTGVSDIRVGERAHLSYSRVQMEGSASFHIGTTRIHLARHSWLETQQFSFGALQSRQDLHISLEGEGAEARVDGLYMVDQEQKTDHHTVIEHLVPHTTSAQLYKGILDGKSRAVFNGRVWIHLGAQQSNAAQLNQNLMLSSKAEVDTKPELEIHADDVKAKHGATIGQMDPEHLFYLQTRAIPREQAERILSRGFAKEIVFRIQHPVVRATLSNWLDTQLSTKGKWI